MNAPRPIFIPPTAYARIKIVHGFDELVATPWGDGVNALCWPRTLTGDFGEVVSRLGVREDIVTLDDAELDALSLSAAGQVARDILRHDLHLLRDRGLSPSLDCIPAYPRDADAGPVPTDVYSFHADSAPVITDTYLCSYNEVASEGLRNDEARRRVDDPATREQLLHAYGGADDDEFLLYLRENCFDLHYSAVPQARPFSFGLGNLWRIANECPGTPVPPCIHRAPTTHPGQSPRLLLIS